MASAAQLPMAGLAAGTRQRSRFRCISLKNVNA
jgi:hypothetical protein